MMGTVTGPLAAPGFFTHTKGGMDTTLTSTALTAQYRENGSATCLSQRGVTTVARHLS